MNDSTNFDISTPSLDDGTPLPTLGKIKMTSGAAKLRKRLSGRDILDIRKAKELDAEAMSERLSKRDQMGRLQNSAPSDRGLVMIFARLHVAGASTVERGRVSEIIRSNWPQFTSNDLKAAQSLAECELDAARQWAARSDKETNVVDLNGFDELCAYGLKQLHAKNHKLTDPTIYHHGTEIVRIPVAPNGEARIEILNQKSFNHVLNNQAPFCRTQGDDRTVITSAPRDVAEHLFADPALPVPVLEKIVRVPTFTKGGKLVQLPGYHKDSGLLYLPTPGLEIPTVPRGDLTEAAKASAGYLVHLFADFPFDGNRRDANEAAPPASMVNFFGLLLTPFVAPIFDDVIPAHLLTKPAPGTGASLLAEACQIVVDGKTETRPPLSRNEEERRKALFTMLQVPRDYAVYDNVAGEIDSPTFASFLTSREWTDRVLGRTGERTVRNSVATVLTGINPGFSKELQRRLSLVKLDAKAAEPSMRTDIQIQDFKGHLRKHRGEVIGHVLILVQHWVNKGMPRASGSPLRSFENWFWTIGGILEAAGFTTFQANRDKLELVTGGADNPMQSLIAAWYEAAQTGGMELTATAGGDRGLLKLVQDHEITLPVRLARGAVDDFAFSPEAFGRFLAASKDATFEIGGEKEKVTVSLVYDGRRNGGTWWKLEVLQNEALNVVAYPSRQARRRVA